MRFVLFAAFLMVAGPAPAAANETLATIFARQGKYMESDTCTACHIKLVKAYEKTPMGHRFANAPQGELEKKNCESCHGPGEKHAEKPKEKGRILTYGKDEPFTIAVQNESCLQCHTKDTKRHWETPADFARVNRCTDCHSVMKPTALVRHGQPPTPEIAAAVKKEFAGQYAGDKLCQQCHNDLTAHYDKTVHARILSPGFEGKIANREVAMKGCEACHGPGKEHAYMGGGRGVGGMTSFKEKGKAAVEKQNGLCLQCHESSARSYWGGSEHQIRGVACTACHTLMERRSVTGLLSASTQMQVCGTCHTKQKAMMFRNAHMPVREGKMDCSSCHNAHGSQNESMLLGNAKNDACYTCHAEKRGPFAWEHPPVNEDCMQCHDPHGSVRAKMLKQDPPRLCQTCHNETQHPTEARLPTNKFVIGRACIQCHSQIHGSNHPSGFAYTR
jgi:DmsE family decaheme c-type cytochrome